MICILALFWTSVSVILSFELSQATDEKIVMSLGMKLL